ncbi:hypothetical protein EMN47_04080 [Prolixibacteraceae bacterium JC049]|nr:hypothetical protein [Prolixibacteraceae bacterium JC049]
MKNLLFLILVLLTTKGYSQYFPVDTAALNQSYRVLKPDSQNKKKQMDFLNAFPSTFSDFTMVYQFVKDPNYDLTMYGLGSEHILNGLAKLDKVPQSIYFKKLIFLCLQGQWEADAPSYLQHLVRSKMRTNTNAMFEILNQLHEGRQISFWYFYYHCRFAKDLKKDLSTYTEQMNAKFPKVVQAMKKAHTASCGMVWY